MSSIAVGIDLGTSNTCVSVWRNNKVEIIPNEFKKNTTPSCVCFAEEGRLVGEVARQIAVVEPKNTIFDVKRIIGRNYNDQCVQDDMKQWPFDVVNDDFNLKIRVPISDYIKLYNPEEISSMVLNKMKEAAEKHLGTTVKECVITVPAYFNDSQRQATIDAGRLANLKVLRIINEPTAAAIAYSMKRNNFDGKVLIYDLGGGTFDVSIVKINGNNIRVLGTGGNTHLGGIDFDRRLADYAAEKITKQCKIEVRSDGKAMRRLRLLCEKAKETLSIKDEATISFLSIKEGISMDMEIKREKFEELCSDLFELTLKIVETCLKEAELEKSDIDEIVLVGGSTKIPKIRSLLRSFFIEKPVNTSLDPDLAVANGASILAYKYQHQANSGEPLVTLTDVTPFSLGIDLMNNKMSTVIPKNTTLPHARTVTYKPEIDNQANFQINVLEGDAEESNQNKKLGTLTLLDVPPRPIVETNLDVTFEIDDNGILTVTCKDRDSEKEEFMKIFHNKGRMTEEEIKRVQEEARKLSQKEKVDEAKSQLFIYCDQTLKNIKKEKYHVNAGARDVLISLIEEALEWLKTNQTRSAEDYLEKLKSISKVCNQHHDYID